MHKHCTSFLSEESLLEIVNFIHRNYWEKYFTPNRIVRTHELNLQFDFEGVSKEDILDAYFCYGITLIEYGTNPDLFDILLDSVYTYILNFPEFGESPAKLFRLHFFKQALYLFYRGEQLEYVYLIKYILPEHIPIYEIEEKLTKSTAHA